MAFEDRVTSTTFLWYAQGGVVRLYDPGVVGGAADIIQIANGAQTNIYKDTSTNSVPPMLALIHNTTATPVANFGSQLAFYNQTTTTPTTITGRLVGRWLDPAHATRKGLLQLIADDSVQGRTVLQASANGTAATFGLYGSAPVARPNVGGVLSGSPTLAQLTTVVRNLIAALDTANVGIINDTTT